MISKFLPVALVTGGLAFMAQTAQAQWSYGYGCSPTPAATAPNGWQNYQQAPPAQPAPPPPAASAQPNQPSGQTAQSNNQPYQSFSAEPAPMNSYAPPAAYPVQTFPTYGGYYGNPYYGGGFYGGYGNSQGWRSLDNANHHGTSW
jgi:hypothetical protein